MRKALTLLVLTALLAFPATAQRIRDLPLDASCPPAGGNFLAEDLAATNVTQKTTVDKLRCGLVSTAFALTCTPPLTCNGTTSADLSAPLTLALSGGGSGTVTSISGPSGISWATATTTPAGSWDSQSSSLVFASPSSGSGTPGWRHAVGNDIQDGTVNLVGKSTNPGTANGLLSTDATGLPQWSTTSGDLALSVLSGTATFQVLSTSLSLPLPIAQGGTNLAAASDDNVMVGNGTTWQSKALTDCQDSTGKHLNYTASSNSFSCGTTSSGGSGTVTSASVTVPSWLSVSGVPITTAGTAAITGATGQTAHRVVGTCSGTSVGLCAPACADLSDASTSCATDATNMGNAASGTLAVTRGGTGTTTSTGSGSVVRGTSPSLTDLITNQAANGDTAIKSIRATDSSPTGNYLDFQSAALSSLFKIDITGSMAAGTVPVARVSGLATSATTDTTNAANITSGLLSSANGGTGAGLGSASGVLRMAFGITSADATLQHLSASTSAMLAGLLTDETGTAGKAVFSTAPTLTDVTLNQTANGDTAIYSRRFTDTTPTGSFMTLQTNGSSTVFGIDITGGVQIGPGAVSAPRLSVSANTVALPAISGTYLPTVEVGLADSASGGMGIDAFGGSPIFSCRQSAGTAASPSAVTSGSTLCALQTWGRGSTAYSAATRAAINYRAAENWTDSAQGTAMDFYTTPAGTGSVTKVASFDAGGHLVMTGSAPSVACTGTGTAPAAPTIAGTDTAFTITMSTGTLPSSSGTCTVTFATAFITNNPVMVCMLVSGASTWGGMSTLIITTQSLTAPVLTWDNTAAGALAVLTASSTYKMSCLSVGR